jgi:hypothetical protein
LKALVKKPAQHSVIIRKKYIRVATRYSCDNFSLSFVFGGVNVLGLGWDISEKGLSFSISADIILFRGQEIQVVLFTSTHKGEYSGQITLKIASKRMISSGSVIYGCAIMHSSLSFDFNKFSCVNGLIDSCDEKKYQAQVSATQAASSLNAAAVKAQSSSITPAQQKAINDSISLGLSNESQSKKLKDIAILLESLEQDLDAMNLSTCNMELFSVVKATLSHIKCLASE